MYYVVEILLALLAVAGLFWLGWLLLGRLLWTGGDGLPTFMVVPATGDGEALEHTVNSLLWLRSGHNGHITVVIVDDGLTATGQTVAQRLTGHEAQVIVCPREEVSAYLARTPMKSE